MSEKILIVDDAAFMRVTLKNMLVKAGYEIVGEAANGREAIKKYKDLKPELVTMDITMPDMGGIEAARNILEIDKNAKIVMCSAMGQKALIVEAIEAGAKDFIIKPFDKKRVLEALSSLS